METINPELRELQQKYENLRAELARTQGEVEQLKHTTRDTSRQTIWQFVIFTLAMAGILVGGIKYQSDTLRSEMNIRFEALEKQLEQSEKNAQAHLDQVEKRLLARFEDLKQEVRASRKSP
jgi:hypothetical protein